LSVAYSATTTVPDSGGNQRISRTAVCGW